MFFNSLDIENFRGIESLKLNNIKQVNLITGRNNCGKTSVLEAIFLLTGMSNPQLTVNIHAFRDMFLTDDGDFNYLFRNYNQSKTPCIRGRLDSQARSLEIQPIYSVFSDIADQRTEKHSLSKEKLISGATDNLKSDLEGIAFSFNIDNGKKFRSEFKLKQGELRLPRDYQENLKASFLNPKTIMTDLDRRLDAILVRKDLDSLVEALKEIEPSLSDIRMGAGGMIYADTGMEKMIPINLMGDGIRRLLAISAAISERKNGIVLIDEIENGLHYSTLFVLWKTVLQTALRNQVQLFITTHSYECIEAMTKVYASNQLYVKQDLISLFRLDRNSGDGHQAFQYEADTLLSGIEKEFEVR